MLFFAILLSNVAKVVVFFIRLFGLGSGTSLPGWLIEKYFPSIIETLTKNASRIILVSGTNGKTTTRSILVKIFESNGVKVCTNRGGANIYRGIATALLFNLNIIGKLKHKTIILEVEEATLPRLTKYVSPNCLVLTNVFRDQLDAYGEIDTTLEYFRQTIKQTSGEIVVNSDDQKLLESLSGIATLNNLRKTKTLTASAKAKGKPQQKRKVSGFGISDKRLKMLDFEESSTKCNIDYTNLLTAHRIDYKNLQTQIESSWQSKALPLKEIKIQSNLLGTYNAYNILAAAAVTIPIFGESVVDAIRDVMPVFGRGEKIVFRNKEIWIFLVKNPSGMNQVLELIESNFGKETLNLSFLINDNIADGKDVSWLWDCSFEQFVKSNPSCNYWTSGQRGLDMLLRLEHANALVSLDDNYESMETLLEEKIFKLDPNPQKHIILGTYTAMMQMRNLISKRVELPKISDEGN